MAAFFAPPANLFVMLPGTVKEGKAIALTLVDKAGMVLGIAEGCRMNVVPWTETRQRGRVKT